MNRHIIGLRICALRRREEKKSFGYVIDKGTNHHEIPLFSLSRDTILSSPEGMGTSSDRVSRAGLSSFLTMSFQIKHVYIPWNCRG